MSTVIPIKVLNTSINVGTITSIPVVIYPNVPVGKTTMHMLFDGNLDNGMEFDFASFEAGYYINSFNLSVNESTFDPYTYQLPCNLNGNYGAFAIIYTYTGGNLSVFLDPNGGPSPSGISYEFSVESNSMSEQPIQYEIDNIIESKTGAGVSILHELVTHGGFRRSSTGTSSNISLGNNDDIVACSPSAGGLTVTLPDSVAFSGKVYSIVNKNSNSTTISPSGSNTIDGSSSLVLSSINAATTLTSDGTGLWSSLL